MIKIGIFSYHDLRNAYSCLFYLQNALNKYMQVDVWGLTPKKDIKIDNYYSFLDTWFGRIPKIRMLFSKFFFFFKTKKYDVIIINDLDFFVEGIFIKHIYKNKVLIHYNTELYNKEDYPTFGYLLKFYEKHADEPDMIIDCIRERAVFRKKQYAITKPIYIIHNTLPNNIEEPDISLNIKKYLNFDNDFPIAIYAGGINDDRGLRFILKDISELSGKVNFLFFLYGNDSDIKTVKGQFGEVDNCRIYKAVERKTLFKIMEYCSIGIQYYDPDKGVNQRYAAPSKFYEYVAMGLNVVSSNNEGINHVIEENKLGICIQPQESFAEAVQRLLKQGLKSKVYIQKIFASKLCYEVDSQEAIKKITEFIDRDDTVKTEW